MSWLCSILTLCTILAQASNPNPTDLYAQLPSPEVSREWLKRGAWDKKQRKEVEKFVKKWGKSLDDFQKRARESERWARGEWLDDGGRQRLRSLRAIMWLRLRLKTDNQTTQAWQEQVDPWLQFAADLAYTEASRGGLELTNEIRQEIYKELLQEWQNNPVAQGVSRQELLLWTLQWRTPWPVDRMLLFEGKKTLSPTSLRLLEKAIPKIQKNPYLSLEKALRQVPGPEPQDLKNIFPLWNDILIGKMRDEMNQLQDLRLRLAMEVFAKQQGREAKSQQDLMTAKVLAQPLMDYSANQLRPLPESVAAE